MNAENFGELISSTMTMPIPALKPIRTGSEMKLAIKPSRNKRSKNEEAPDHQRQHYGCPEKDDICRGSPDERLGFVVPVCQPLVDGALQFGDAK